MKRALTGLVLLAAALAASVANCQPVPLPTSPGAAGGGDPGMMLRQALSELGGSFTPFDMRGSPAQAGKIAARAERRALELGRADVAAEAREIEAMAAAAGGEYSQAVALSKDIGPSLEPQESEALGVAQRAWSRLRLSLANAAFLFGYDFQYQYRQEIENLKEPSESPRARLPSHPLFAVWLHAIAEATLATSSVDPPRLKSIAATLAAQDMATACGSSPCVLGHLLRARLFSAGTDLVAARQELEQARTLAERTTDPSTLGVITLAIGDLLAAPNGDPFDLNLSSLRIARTTLESNSGSALDALAAVPDRDLVAAEGFYREAGQFFRAAQMSRGMAHCDARAAYLSFLRGRYLDASQGFQRAAAAFRDSGDVQFSRRAAMAEIAVLLAAEAYPQSDAAYAALSDDLAAHAAVGLQWTESLMLRSLARWLMGAKANPHAALIALTHAAALADLARLPYVAQDAYADLADLHALLGRPDEAAEAWQGARRAIAEWESHLSAAPAHDPVLGLAKAAEAHLLQGIIRDSIAMRDFARARETNEDLRGLLKSIDLPRVKMELEQNVYENEVSLAVSGAGPPPAGMNERSQAILRLRQGAKAAAAEKIKGLEPEALAALRALTPTAHLLLVQAVKSELEIQIQLEVLADRYDAARRLWDEAEQKRPGWLFQDPSKPWDRHRVRAELLESAGDAAHAEAELRTSIAAAEASAAKLGNVQQAARFLDETTAPYRSYAHLLAHSNRAAEALAMLEQARARVFQAQVTLAGSFAADSPKSRSLAAWRAASAALSAVRARRAQAQTNKDAETDARLAADEQATAAKVEQLEAALGSLRGLLAPMDAKHLVAAVSGALDPQAASAAIVYATLGDEVWAWVIDRSGLRVTAGLSVTRQRLRRLAQAFRNDISLPSDAESSARTLYNALLAPLRSALPKARAQPSPHPRLAIVAAGSLLGIPFHALRDEQGPLLDEFDIFYAPSLRSYVTAVEASRDRLRELTVRAFAGIEPTNAAQEVSDLSPWGHPFVNDAATPAAFEAAAMSPGVLHAAAHGHVDPVNPFFSTLRFGDKREVSGFDILSLDVKSWLVVLAACEAGVFAPSPADEWTSIGSAFLATGVPTVVAAAWDVSDRKTVDLMKAFYAKLRDGVSPVAALSDAQRGMMHDGEPPKYASSAESVGEPIGLG